MFVLALLLFSAFLIPSDPYYQIKKEIIALEVTRRNAITPSESLKLHNEQLQLIDQIPNTPIELEPNLTQQELMCAVRLLPLNHLLHLLCLNNLEHTLSQNPNHVSPENI